MESRDWGWSRLIAPMLMLLFLAGLGCTDSAPPAPSGVAEPLASHHDGNGGALAAAHGICGVISATLVITEDSRLTCDVVCMNAMGPCIQFGGDNITLWLNGFTMRGPATPPSGCAASPAFGPGNPGPFPFDGISTAGFARVSIRGPGMVETFRRHGIFVFESEGALVERVTSHDNCYSGIMLALAHNADVTENVSVRNGIASGAAPCGGNCITNSNGNRIRRNHFYGNGSVAPGAPLGTPNDFGVGLVGTSSYNLIEDNSIGGNINGIILYQQTVGNQIRRNVIAGNPPVQVSVTAGAPVGVDILDASAPGANAFAENHCITYQGAATPRPCPNLAVFRGHD